jgi:hypothetical protein
LELIAPASFRTLSVQFQGFIPSVYSLAINQIKLAVIQGSIEAPGGQQRPVTAPLITHCPQVTAQGIVPSTLGVGVTYDVSVEEDGLSFGAGTFRVIGAFYNAPVITPSQGPVGTNFTLDDALARLQPGDEA